MTNLLPRRWFVVQGQGFTLAVAVRQTHSTVGKEQDERIAMGLPTRNGRV